MRLPRLIEIAARDEVGAAGRVKSFRRVSRRPAVYRFVNAKDPDNARAIWRTVSQRSLIRLYLHFASLSLQLQGSNGRG